MGFRNLKLFVFLLHEIQHKFRNFCEILILELKIESLGVCLTLDCDHIIVLCTFKNLIKVL